MANSETAWLRIHDTAALVSFQTAFRQHTGYKSNGGAANPYWFQYSEMRCSKHQTFAENRNELREIIAIWKKNKGEASNN